MPDFSVVMTHTAGSCPIFKAETRKKFNELWEKKRKLLGSME